MGNKSNSLQKHKKKEPQNEDVEGSVIAYELRKIIRSHYPDFYEKLANVADHRKRKDYRSDELLTAAISMFIFKSQSRRCAQ